MTTRARHNGPVEDPAWMSTVGPDTTDGPAGPGPRVPKAGQRAGGCLALGLLAGTMVGFTGLRDTAPLVGWDTAVCAYLLWVWIPIWGVDAATTARLAVREDASSAITDTVLLLAAVASLVGVGDVIVLGRARGNAVGPGLAIGLAVGSVVASWALVHTIFTLRYTRLYYVGQAGGIDFNQDDPPRYSDFAYLAFTIGMTFQVSDTALKGSTIRATALRHALLSYLFGAFIIAVTINLIAGLAK
jgi:uncharacterized membrane protein